MTSLNINYRVRIRLGHLGADAGALALDDVTEYLRRKLLTLVVADDANLDFLFVVEEDVVVHLARDEGIGTLAHGIVQQEVAGTTADGHRLDGALQQFVTHGALDAELSLDQFDEGPCSHRLRPLPYHTATGLDAINSLPRKEPAFRQSQPPGNLPVHAVLCIIHIGMHGHDDHIVLDGLDDAALHFFTQKIQH